MILAIIWLILDLFYVSLFHNFTWIAKNLITISWIKRFILFHDKKHPREMGELEV